MGDRQIKVKWAGALQFIATDSDGHSLVMDVSKGMGGEGAGFRPVEMLLVALAGCTAVDVVEILRKQRQPLVGMEVVVQGQRAADHPKVYTEIEVEYVLKGKGFNEAFIQRAIQLSEEKYCSVRAMLAASAKVASRYRVIEG